MKKAFMRGVCALNMEAMNMFHEPEPNSTSSCTEQPANQPTNTMSNELLVNPTSLYLTHVDCQRGCDICFRC